MNSLEIYVQVSFYAYFNMRTELFSNKKRYSQYNLLPARDGRRNCQNSIQG